MMLTPAEEIGLSGATLSGRVRSALSQLSAADFLALQQRVRAEALARRLYYVRDDVPDAIRVLPCPMTALPDQMTYLHYVTLTIQNALKRLPELYMQDFAVRAVLQLTPEEDEWLWRCWGPSQREYNPVFGRLDALIDFTSPMWKNTLHFIEPNLSGIGGLHLVPTADGIMQDVVLPALQRFDPELELTRTPDIRDLLLQEMLEHLEALGRKGRNICLLEPKYAGSGPAEQAELVNYFRAHNGLEILHADPSELRMRGKEVYFGEMRVDLAYRDYTVLDVLELEKLGVDIEPMRTLFRENRILSSITAELDQKSCWEIFTDPQFTQKYYSADERQVFRRHILWTRLLRDRQTLLPNGVTGSLLEYVREERETLVLKPNRAYGGEGVIIGQALTQAEWEAALEHALMDAQRWVVQRLASIPLSEFPVIGPDGKVLLEPFHVVMGFAATKYGLAILGRASQKQVVNVAQRGGMCSVFVGRPLARLHGPDAA